MATNTAAQTRLVSLLDETEETDTSGPVVDLLGEAEQAGPPTKGLTQLVAATRP